MTDFERLPSLRYCYFIFRLRSFPGDTRVHDPPPKFNDNVVDEEKRRDLFQIGLQNTINRLKAAGKKIVIFMDAPELSFFPKDCLQRTISVEAPKECEMSRKIVEQRQKDFMGLVEALQRTNPDVRFFDAKKILCDDKKARLCMMAFSSTETVIT